MTLPQRSTNTPAAVSQRAAAPAGSAAARILPFAAYIAFVAISDGLSWLGMSERDLRWLYPIKIAVVVALLLTFRRAYSELARPAMSARCAGLSAAVGVAVLVLWINLDASWMQIGASAGFDPRNSAGGIDWLLVAVRLAGAALVVPLMEELFWRSFLLRWLEERDFLNVDAARVGLRSVLVTVVLFGFEHNLWLAGIVAGVAYSWLYMRTGNLWAPILAHAVTNGLLGVWVIQTASWTYW
jgi:CAAX prenyl protease-like protein